jgi:hypothetical protein
MWNEPSFPWKMSEEASVKATYEKIRGNCFQFHVSSTSGRSGLGERCDASARRPPCATGGARSAPLIETALRCRQLFSHRQNALAGGLSHPITVEDLSRLSARSVRTQSCCSNAACRESPSSRNRVRKGSTGSDVRVANKRESVERPGKRFSPEQSQKSRSTRMKVLGERFPCSLAASSRVTEHGENVDHL